MQSVLIIGLGNVSVGYDSANVSSNKVLSHARAFSIHPSFQLVGGVDPNDYCRLRFEKNYGVFAYFDIETAMREFSPDIVVVATPTELHKQTILAIFEAGRPQYILCEKPLAYNLGEARQIHDICLRQNCKLYLNFFRQVEPGVEEIRARLKDGRIALPLKGVVWYSKGLFNSGVHFFILLQNLLGEVKSVNVINSGRIWRDIDPEPDLEVAFARGRVVFLSAREEDYFHNSLELVAPNGRLRYELGGSSILWQGVKKDERFERFDGLIEVGETIPNDFDRIQWYVVEHLANAIKGFEVQLCSGEEALRIQEVLDNILGKL